MKFISQNNADKTIIRGLNFLKFRGGGKGYFDTYTRQIEHLTSSVEGKIILNKAKNNKGMEVPIIEVETAQGKLYATYPNGNPAFIYAEDFLKGPSAVLAKVSELLSKNRDNSIAETKINSILINALINNKKKF